MRVPRVDDDRAVFCPYCKARMPLDVERPQSHVELRAETENRPIEPGKSRVICKACDQPWLVRVVALAAPS